MILTHITLLKFIPGATLGEPPPTPPEERTATPGWPLDHPPRKRGRDEIERESRDATERARAEFGILPLAQANAAIANAIEARTKAIRAESVQAKLDAAREQLEAEELYRKVYLDVYGDVVADHLEEMFRREFEQARERRERELKVRAALCLLMANS